MTLGTFGEEFVAYFSRTKDAVIGEVSKFLSRVPETYYARIYETLIAEVPPNRSPGVSDIRDICERIGAPVSYRSPAAEQRSYTVTCDSCGYEYRWAQGALPDQAIDHIFDFCPRCKFPYSETITMLLYEQYGRKKMWEPFYEKQKERYVSALKAGPIAAGL